MFWLIAVPVLLTRTVNVIAGNLSHNSKYKIEIVNPRVKTDILPVIRFKADKISVVSKKESLNVDIEKLKIKFRILPLLSGKFHINSLCADSVNMATDLKSEPELDKDFFDRLDDTKIVLNVVDVKNFILTLRKDMKDPIIYSGQNFLYKNKNRYLLVKLKSKLNIENKISETNINLYLPKNNDIEKTVFNLDVNSFDLSHFRMYFKHYLPKDLVSLTGIVNIAADNDNLEMSLNNFSANMSDEAKSLIFPEELNIKSEFKIKKNCIKFNNLDIESNNIHTHIDGKVNDYFGKAMPTLDLNIRVNKSKVEDFVNMLPPFVVEDINAYKLKKYKFYGDVLANMSIKGRLPEPDIVGDIFVNNGILIRPIPNASSGATIKIKLTGKHANYDVYVPAGGSEKVWVKGGVELYNIKYADLTVKSTSSVNLQSAENVVNPLHEILNFVIGPVPIMDVHGTGNIDIQVKGNRKNPHVWGVLNFYDASVKFNEIPALVWNNADAVLTFNDQNAVFTTKKGMVSGKDFQVNGICDLLGKFDFDVLSENVPVEPLYKAISTATLIPDTQKMIPKLDKVQGTVDLKLKVYGTVKYIEDLVFGKNAFAKGEILLKDNAILMQGVNIKNANGKINFDTNSADADVTASVSDAQMKVKAKVKNNIGDLILNVPRLNPNFIIKDADIRDVEYLPYISVDAKYKGDINNIEYNNIWLNGRILESNPKSPIKFKSGEISIENGRAVIKNLRGYVENFKNAFYADLRISNAFTQNPDVNGNAGVTTFELRSLNRIISAGIIPGHFGKYVKDYEFGDGVISANCRFVNSKLNTDVNLDKITFIYLPAELPIKIINGNISVRNNLLKLNKINMLADNMPILADGTVKDVLTKRIFDIYINSKPKQEFIDKYINKNLIYPIKIKGDIVYWAKIKGIADNYDLKAKIDLSKDSSIYHFGATIGDIENAISVYLDSKINGTNMKIKEFSYDKLIDSLNGKQTRFNLLKAWGGLGYTKDDILFNDLHIKTSRPTDARIFNILFRKPNIKQGQFTSDLKINNKLSNPRVLGEFHIFETNIPFFDTTMKNIELIFKDKTLEITSKGDVMGNDVSFEGILKNKLTMPYHIERATLYTKDLDLNRIVNTIKTSQVEAGTISAQEQLNNIDLNIITADNFKVKADNIELRNIRATNFESSASLNNRGLLNVNKFKLNIAQGDVNGSYKYNFKNNDVGINIDAKDINANDITYALFDLNNQIYGDLTGKLDMSCNGKDFKSCMQTLSGKTSFVVTDGKMPKLGSLEYLLRAGNLLKGGITSISINSVIDLITPLKTGEFSDIYGTISIKDGLADDIEITTKGKNLSLFISGTYNLSTSIADMEVLGLLSKKISTFLGPIGNMSINTLFSVIPGVDLSKDSKILDRINKIPGVELSNKMYRKFLAEIKGNINSDDYVTSFSWIN